MPVMDGLTATAQIRALGGKYKSLPIIAMTAHARKEDIEKSLTAGMDAHLTKPVEPEKIFSLLGKWIPLDAALPMSASTTTEKNLIDPNNFLEIDIKGKIDTFNSLSTSDLAAAETVLLEILEANPTDPIANQIMAHFDSFDIDAIYPLLDHFVLTISPNNIA